jgi:hypothetical protein
MSKSTRSAASDVIRELANTADNGQVENDLPREQVMQVAAAFARILLDEADAGKSNTPSSYTEFVARREAAKPDRTEDDERFDRDAAVSDFAQELNEDASFSGDDEFAPNVFDIDDVVDRIAARMRQR